MTTDIVLFGTRNQMRQQAAAISVIQLLRESCFLSHDRQRHLACRDRALELLNFSQDSDVPSDDRIEEAIRRSPQFAAQFYCLGRAYACASCGSLMGPGYTTCPECSAPVDEPTGILAKPEWETRLTTKALEIAILTDAASQGLLMHTINRTVRLFVLRNQLGHSSLDSWQFRVKEIRETVLDAWPEGYKPSKESWEYRYIRACAVFWVVAWPMLRQAFNLQAIDERFNSKLIRAVSVSAQRWADAGADGGEYASLVRQILDAGHLDAEKLIAALVPPSQNGSANRGRLILHPPEIIMRGSVVYSPLGDPWLLSPLEPEEDKAIIERYGLLVEEPDLAASRFLPEEPS